MELRDYYKQLDARKLESSTPEAPRSGMYRDELESKGNPASKIMYLGGQERDLAERTAKLDTMMNRAKSGISGALDELMEKYGREEPPVMAIKVNPSMVNDGKFLDRQGVEHEKFGIREIKDDAQMAKMSDDVEKAKAYLPDVKLTEISDAEGRRIAVVTGAEAKEFNAVMRAEREHAELKQQTELLASEKKNTFGKMGLNSEVAVSGGNTTAKAEPIAITPAAEKTKDLQLA